MDTIQAMRSKQAARIIVSKEEIVRNMVSEGLLTAGHAEEMLETISHQALEVEAGRVKLYKEQARLRAKERKQQKVEERHDERALAQLPRSTAHVLAPPQDAVPALGFSWGYCVDSRLAMALVTGHDFVVTSGVHVAASVAASLTQGWPPETGVEQRQVMEEEEEEGAQLRCLELKMSPSRPLDTVLVQLSAAGVCCFRHP